MSSGTRGGTWCAVPNCSMNTKLKSVSLFGFPKDPERCKKWISSIGRYDLLVVDHIKLRYMKVCGYHFEEKMFLNDLKNRLHNNAVPTLNIPGEERNNMEIIDNAHTKKRENSSDDRQLPDAKKIKILDMNILQLPSTSSSTLPEKDTSKDINSEKESTSHNLSVALQTSSTLSSHTPRKEKLRLKLRSERKKNVRARANLGALRTSSSESEAEEIAILKKLCAKYFSKDLLALVNVQIDLMGKSVKGSRYSNELKQIALNIYFLGPKVYKYLQKILRLPTKRTLEKLTAHWSVRPGFNPFVMKLVGTKLTYYPDKAGECILCMDEVSLKKNLFYNLKEDEIIGFQQLNGSKTFEPAQFALVFMLRGIHHKWKQQIQFVLVARSCTDDNLKSLITQCVSRLMENGCIVKALVSDIGSNFYKLVKTIGITPEQPYFYVNDNKIFYIFDVPHLVKATRNNFFKHHFEYGNYRTDKQHVEMFYNKDKILPLRLAPKLTDSHLHPDNFQKMKVKLAVQVLSSTVAAALTAHVAFGSLPTAAAGTIDFIEKIDKLFDILNSSNTQAEKFFNRPLKGEEFQIKFLQEMLEFFRNVKVINIQNKNVTNQIKSVWCWQITISSILQLWEYLEKQILYTRRLNQDALENFFGAIRQQSGNARNPTPIQFQRAFKKLFCTDYFLHSEGANCANDLDEVLKTMNEINYQQINFIDTEEPITDKEIKIPDTDYRNLEYAQQNALTYVSGYLIYKCLRKHTCNICVSYANAQKHLDTSFLFTHFKSYEDKENNPFGKLNLPEDDFYNYINKLECCFLALFNSVATQQGIGAALKTEFLKIPFTHPCTSFPSDYLLNLFTRFRIFSSLKFINRDLSTQKGKNYKYINVAHL